MKTPSIYSTQLLKLAFNSGISVGLPDGRWVPARPEPWRGLMLRRRIKAAWLVFTGRADVIQWEQQS